MDHTVAPAVPRSGTGVPAVLTDVAETAVGRRHHDDPVRPRTGGPAGNARLTAWTGLVLLVLFLAQLVTLLDVSGLISWHVVLGTLLVPPALLKTASTGWRMVRYYRHDDAYERAGPPPLLLRVLGPGVVLSTLGLLGSGLALVALSPVDARTVLVAALGQRVDAVTVHQALFIVWAVLTGLHVLARVVPALRLTVAPRTGGTRGVDGGRRRLGVAVAALAVAVVSAAIVLAAAAPWRAERGGPDGPDGRRSGAAALPGDAGP